METKKAFFKRASTWWIFGIGLIVLFVILTATRGKHTEYETTAAAMGNIAETVNVTGQIKPENSAELRFKLSGIIEALFVDVGDVVGRGQLLARLNTAELQKELTRREAELNTAEIGLKNAIQDREDTLVRNNQSLAKVYSDAPKTFSDILNLSEKSFTVLDSFYDDNYGDILQPIQESIRKSILIADANTARFKTETAIATLRENLQNFPTAVTQDKIRATITAIESPLRDMRSSMTTMINLVNGIESGFYVDQTTLDGYKTTLATAQADVDSAISKEITLLRDLNDALINSGLNVNTSDATVRLKEADAQTAEAAVEIAKRNISDAYLYTPISGTVAVKDKQLGELVTASDRVYFVIGTGDLEVIANIPEVDIGLVSVNDPVDATLDALGSSEHFSAYVESVDPDQTTIDGVVYYKTHITFSELDPRFKSGMSVNLDIIVNQKDSALIIPRRAVKQLGGKTTVLVYAGPGNTPEEREVKVGLRGETEVEILSGLTEGEIIVVAEK